VLRRCARSPTNRCRQQPPRVSVSRLGWSSWVLSVVHICPRRLCLTSIVSLAPMNKITINNRSVLRVLLGVYLLPIYLVVFSLSVPPNDLPICGLMFALAGVGYMLARRESRAWRLIWGSALAISVLCGVLEVVAGQRVARQRLQHQTANEPYRADRRQSFSLQGPIGEARLGDFTAAAAHPGCSAWPQRYAGDSVVG